jgi:hypothetical protein
MLPRSEAQQLRRLTWLDVTLDRVLIRYAFVEIITESETYHVYKVVLLTI